MQSQLHDAIITPEILQGITFNAKANNWASTLVTTTFSSNP